MMKTSIVILVLILALNFILGCLPATFRSCCQQCLDAAAQDPSGYDISIKECVRYEVSPDCTEYFTQNTKTVGECRQTYGGLY